MTEAIIQVIVGIAIVCSLIYIAFNFGYYKGYIDGHKEDVHFGYFAAKDGVELLSYDHDDL